MRFDMVLVGGGLANTLIAYRLKQVQPDLRVLVIEQGQRLGGNHTWSFHAGDLSAAQHAWLEPLVVKSWPRQEVRFPKHARVIKAGYHSISSDRLHEVCGSALAPDVILGTGVVTLDPGRVVLSDQRTIEARCVIDGRGPRPDHAPDPALALGYQKFVGLEIDTVEPHGQEWPIIMDATVAQADGYRFVYTLPFTDRRILIEDTYYSDTPALDRAGLIQRARDYAARRGWRVASVVREEAGVLPIVLAGDMARFWSHPPGAPVPRSGLRACLFHPTTGFSLPDAVGLAELMASETNLTSAAVHTRIRDHSMRLWRERGFFRLLNRMLFVAATPGERVAVLERFYRLPEPLIKRFYAGQITFADKARIVVGRPPVPIGKGLGCVNEASGWTFARQSVDTAPIGPVASEKAGRHG